MSKISVIVPTYRSKDSLDLCLRSLIEGCSNISNIEIITVIDGTYDYNKETLDKYGNSVYKLILPENRGLCAATNLGVYNASNENIFIINDDNVAPKGWDKLLNQCSTSNTVWSPNQVEPIPSIFSQFVIDNLGRNPKTFDLEYFWEYADGIKDTRWDMCGSTLPIFMSKIDFLRIGGWDENYTDGLVADWDFFLKCQLSGLQMLRTYNCHFYHFVSLSTNITPEQQLKRQKAEQDGHAYAKYKWGKPIQHNPYNNLKYL